MATVKEKTHREFSQENQQFISACRKAGVPASPRQAAKYRQQKGKAYAAKDLPDPVEEPKS